MATTQNDLARQLSDSIARLQEQVEKVEFWASAISGFAQPVPDYEPEMTKIGNYVRPGRLPRKRRPRRSARMKSKDSPQPKNDAGRNAAADATRASA